MMVKDVMTSDARSCSADTDLATAATLMWNHDCGVVPVLSDSGNVVGLITDRDIAIAATTRFASPANILVRDVISGKVHACGPNDDVRTALKTMKDNRVRRLPVVDQQRRLVGILSMNDLIVRADFRRGADLSAEECVDTLKGISMHSQVPVSV